MSLSRTLVSSLVALTLVLGAPGLQASASVRPFQVRMGGPAGTAVRRAVYAVRARLADERCRRILTDFDVGGRSLDETLASRGLSAGEHLDSLVFRDGSGKTRCQRQGVLAFTHVGGDTIFVCTASFGRASDHDPRFAEVVVIHELLHTLGLAENPPTSGEITARVEQRCGS